MFTLDRTQLLHLAGSPAVLGAVIERLAIPDDHDGTSIEMEPRNGWRQVSTSRLAVQRYGDLEMRSYRDPSGSIVLTLVEGRRLLLYAEGWQWQIETDGPPHAWRRGGHYAHAQKPGARPAMVAAAGDSSRQIDLSNAGMSETPSYVKEDFDWIAQIANQPTATISRLHMLALKVGLNWRTVERSERPTGDMMLAIERARGMRTVPTRNDVHAMPLLARIRAAEQAAFGEVRDTATRGTVEALLTEIGFDHVLSEDRDGAHEDHWLLETGDPQESLLMEHGEGWAISRAPTGDEPRGQWVEHATGLTHAKALTRIRAVTMRPEGEMDVTAPTTNQIVRLADAVGATVVRGGAAPRQLETLLNILAALDIRPSADMTVSRSYVEAMQAAYGPVAHVIHPF